ncbi:MAG: ATP phosphoribosyltransferase [Ardenticatenaceae bacterium]|nr:ATP phosphoribosyltransferase [Ardenticatenaceae bacterium]MCB8949494.1 ATP phosphoribosyltransferase [Ardenticatenaceae bacterium]
MSRTDIRLALPSKGALHKDAFDFLEACGLKIFRPNPRQYEATIPSLPELTVMFQRPGDIVAGVREGSLDFGMTGLDILAEKAYGRSHTILVLHDSLGFGPCTLNLAVPEAQPAHTMADLAAWAKELGENGRSLRVATKFPKITGAYLEKHGVAPVKLISVEGTLEIAPTIGYADIISDLVSSGITLRDNHLRTIEDGEILASQACLIANKEALKTRPEVLSVARQLIEYIEAHLRAENSYLVTTNVRGSSPEDIAEKMLSQPHLRGLRGPTIAPVVARHHVPDEPDWFAVNIVVQKSNLFQAIAELRAIGGSGVVVSPCKYIFEEEPERYRAMLTALNGNQ